jgi:Skp family chaperone for outer membrane proteins
MDGGFSMKRIGWLLGLGICLIQGTTAFSLDIPLSGGVDGKGGVKIGYVDLDKIFELYPQTKNAKEDYAKQLNIKHEALAAREKEIETIKNKIAVLEETFKDMEAAVPPSPDGVVASTEVPALPVVPPQNIAQLTAQLEKEKQRYAEARKQSAEELKAFENQQSNAILGKIYRALQDLALEEQVSIVVDKSSVLYGTADVDLTEKLSNKVRGY